MFDVIGTAPHRSPAGSLYVDVAFVFVAELVLPAVCIEKSAGGGEGSRRRLRGGGGVGDQGGSFCVFPGRRAVVVLSLPRIDENKQLASFYGHGFGTLDDHTHIEPIVSSCPHHSVSSHRCRGIERRQRKGKRRQMPLPCARKLSTLPHVRFIPARLLLGYARGHRAGRTILRSRSRFALLRRPSCTPPSRGGSGAIGTFRSSSTSGATLSGTASYLTSFCALF